MSIEKKKEVYEFMKESNNVSMRTFIKAAGLAKSEVRNWQRKTLRYL
jgi:hypothetical protein